MKSRRGYWKISAARPRNTRCLTTIEAGSDFSDNELHAAGRVCARCGAVIQPGEDTRLRADRQWVHEICPLPD